MATFALGTLTLDLVTRIGGFQQGMDKAGRVAEQNARRIDKAFSGVKRTLAGAFAALGVGSVLREVVSATAESEKAIAGLNQALKSTGGTVGRSSRELQDFASSLQQTSTYTDEAIIGAQSLLLAFRNIKGDNFDRATQAVLDLSAALGQDLPASAQTIGKALNDPVRAIQTLRRSGVQLADEQSALIKRLVEVGDAAGAQRVILDELAGLYGGRAKAQAETLGGSLQQLRNAFGDLFELGNGPEAGALREAIQNLTQTIQSPALKESLADVAGALSKIITFGAQAAGGLAVLFGKSGNQVEDLTRRYGDLTAAIERSRGALNLFGLTSGAKQITADLIAQRKAVATELQRIQGLGVPGVQTPAILAVNKAFQGAIASAQQLKDKLEAPVSLGAAAAVEQLKVDLDEIAVTAKRIEIIDSDDVARQLQDFQTQLLEMKGQTAEAFRIRFEVDTSELRKALNYRGDTAGLEQLDNFREVSVAQAKFNELRQRSVEIGQALALTEERIARTAATGAISQLDSLNSTEDAREAAIADYQALLDTMQETAAFLAGKGFSSSAITATVAETTAAVEELQAQSELMASYAEGQLSEAFASPFKDFVTGAKSAGEAARAFFQDLQSRILDVISQNFAEKLFGGLLKGSSSKGGGSGFVGSILGSLFGGFRDGGLIPAYADGGLLHGPGTGTSDSILAMGPRDRPIRLSNGEFVVRAAAVRQPGVLHMLREINTLGAASSQLRERLTDYRTDSHRQEVRFASGGMIGGSAVDVYLGPQPAGPGPQPKIGDSSGERPIIVNNTFTVQTQSGKVSRATEQQIAAAAHRGIMRAARRN